MATGRFIAYYRVSTDKQGRSGLGLEAQQEAVRRYLNGGDWLLLGSFTEVESGKKNDRPELAKAMAACRVKNATLIIGKLDRLSRNTRFLLSIVEGTGDAGVVFCDLPNIPAGPVGKFMVTQMASVAELEAGLISQRTKAALAAVKARGVALGGDRGYRPSPEVAQSNCARATAAKVAKAAERIADVIPMIRDIQAEIGTGATLKMIAAALNDRGALAPRGDKWQAAQVWRVMQRAA